MVGLWTNAKLFERAIAHFEGEDDYVAKLLLILLSLHCVRLSLAFDFKLVKHKCWLDSTDFVLFSSSPCAQVMEQSNCPSTSYVLSALI